MKLVYVEWTDSCSPPTSAWRDLHAVAADVEGEFICSSVGWVAAENKINLVLVAHLGGSQACGQMTIPKCAIRKRKRIRL